MHGSIDDMLTCSYEVRHIAWTGAQNARKPCWDTTLANTLADLTDVKLAKHY